jgi:Big-like domain-containing protein
MVTHMKIRLIRNLAILFFTPIVLLCLASAQTAPSLASVTPANGATNVPLSSTLVFVFDQDMDTSVSLLPSFPPFLVGNFEVSPITAVFMGAWEPDDRTLTCTPAIDLPANTTITYKLNPPGATLPFSSASGQPLATVSGSFTTGGSGGGGTCDPSGVPSTWGHYSVSKSLSYDQTSTADPVPRTDTPFFFGVFVSGPQSGPAVTAGSITPPNQPAKDLTMVPLTSFLSLSETPATESALETTFPPGGYVLRFTQTGQPERVISMTMPATGTTIPKIANFTEAQAVNAAQDFTLRWNAFASAGADSYISLVISDNAGKTVFQAPDACVPRTLAATATSIVIPANTLRSNVTYNAILQFGRVFYNSTNDVPQMAGSGSVARITYFTIKTTGSATGVSPAQFVGFRLLSNGHPELNLTGTASRTYTVERTGSLGTPVWVSAGSATMDATGNARFEDLQVPAFPVFYRVVGN